MRHLQPVDIVVDFDLPESGFFSDESMTEPVWGTTGMSRTFFGRADQYWVIWHAENNHLYLDGERLRIPRRLTSDARIWRLIDVERFAHALAEQGLIPIEQLVRVLEMVRIVCEQWGHVSPRPLQTRAEEHDPTREELYAVTTEPTATDDLDGAEHAFPRSFALGEVTYHLDLTDEHWNDLLAAMAPYVKAARRSPHGASKSVRRVERSKVRAWALRKGYPIGARGRIPQAIMDAYLRRGA